jgi:hypothetical protein
VKRRRQNKTGAPFWRMYYLKRVSRRFEHEKNICVRDSMRFYRGEFILRIRRDSVYNI